MKVLDIGSGQHPHPNATDYLEKYPDENVERGADFVKPSGRLHIGDVEDMHMFKDKEFDFSYCKHVLEHVIDPVKACNEIMRVSKAGYIETPATLWEAHFGRKYHKWTVEKYGNKLVFSTNVFKPTTLRATHSLDKLYASDPSFRQYFDSNIDRWYVRFEWADSFEVEVFQLGKK